MSDATQRPQPRPRPTAAQKSEWEAAFATATGQPPVVGPAAVDPDAAQIYGIMALCVAVSGTMATAGLFWLTPTGGLSILFLSALVASRFSRLSGGSEFGQRAARWSYWMFVMLPVASLVATGMTISSMDFSRFLPAIEIKIPDGLLG